MKKLFENPIIVGILVILLVAVATGTLFSVAGYTVLSLTRADFVQNDAQMMDNVWLMYIAVNQRDQHAMISQSFSSADSTFYDPETGVTPQNAVTLNIESSKQKCAYSIDNRGQTEKIYTIYPEILTVDPIVCIWNPSVYCSRNDAETACKSRTNYFAAYAKQNERDTYCFLKNTYATHGILGTLYQASFMLPK